MNQQATLSQRFFATCIDFLILPPLCLLVMLVTGLTEDADAYVMPWFFLRLWRFTRLKLSIITGLHVIHSSADSRQANCWHQDSQPGRHTGLGIQSLYSHLRVNQYCAHTAPI